MLTADPTFDIAEGMLLFQEVYNSSSILLLLLLVNLTTFLILFYYLEFDGILITSIDVLIGHILLLY